MLKRYALIEGALRAQEPGAPIAYVTTRKFLEVFGLGSLCDRPDIKRLEEDGILIRGQPDADLDGAVGLSENGECEEDARDEAATEEADDF